MGGKEGGFILGRRPPSGREFWEGRRRLRPPKGEVVVVAGGGGCGGACRKWSAMFDFVVGAEVQSECVGGDKIKATPAHIK